MPSLHSPAALSTGAVPVLLTTLLLAAAASAEAQDRGRPAVEPEAEQRIIELTNEFRREHELQAVREDPDLAEAAQEFAEFMARTDRHSHTADSRQPSERAAAAGYDFCLVLENIGFQFRTDGFRADELARRFVDGWEESPEHRRNLLNRHVTDIGVGVARSDETGRYYAVQKFGLPEDARIEFSLSNRTDATVRYRLDDRTFSLPPRMTRTHGHCIPQEIVVLDPPELEGEAFEPGDGERYLFFPDEAGEPAIGRERPRESSSPEFP